MNGCGPCAIENGRPCCIMRYVPAYLLIALACSPAPTNPLPPVADAQAPDSCVVSTSCCANLTPLGDETSLCDYVTVAHGCEAALAFGGPELSCDCGWSDCLNQGACETDITSDDNCGVCGVSASPCVVGVVNGTLLYSSGYEPEGLAVDSQYVYWMSDGVLRSALKDGSGTPTVLTQTQPPDLGGKLTLADGYLYWISSSGSVERIATMGGAVETIAILPPPIRSNPVVYAGTLYVVAASGMGGVLVGTDGTTLLSTSDSAALALFGSLIFVSDAGGVRSVRFDGSDVTVRIWTPVPALA
jgi:hypothetical protein